MRSIKAGKAPQLAISLGLVLSAGCHYGNLTALSGTLAFSSPDEPAELMQPDAGVVQIAFGEVLVGSTKTLTLAFASIGDPVTLGVVTAVQPDAEFSLPFVPGTVVQAVPSEITVSFTPTSVGNKSAVLQLAAYSSGTAIVVFELSGVGVANGLSVVPNPVDFGEVEINHSQSVALTITNNGLLAATLALSPLQGQYPERFSLGTPSSTALAPGGSATLNVAFVPLLDGPAGASFTVSPGPVSSESTGGSITVNLGGTGVDSWIQVTSPLEFGFVQLGDTRVKLAVITNVSSYETLHLVAPAPAVVQPSGQSAFSLADAGLDVPVAIPPGQSVSLPISFAPQSLDQFSGTLLLTTDDTLDEYPLVELDGYGGGPQISCLPTLSFGPVPVGSTASEDSFCMNAGTDIPSLPKLALQIAQSGLSADSSAFVPSLVLPDGGVAGPGYDVALFAGQQATIRVAFRPEDAGAFENRLTVLSNDLNDLDAGTLLLAQGGVSGTCNLEVTPTQLSFGEVPPGGRGILQFELSNTSQAFCQITRVGLDPDSIPPSHCLMAGLAPRS